MDINVEVIVTIKRQGNKPVTQVREAYAGNSGDNPRFERHEVKRVLDQAAHNALQHFDGSLPDRTAPPAHMDMRKAAEADVTVTSDGTVLKYRHGDPKTLRVYVVPDRP